MEIDMETLEKTLKESKSYRDAGRKLNACHTNIRRLARQYGIDCSHFTFGKAYDDLVEREFGILVVREIIPPKKENRHRATAICDCKCGGTKEIRCDALKEHRYYSCGCHAKNRLQIAGSKNPAFAGVGELGKSLFNQWRRGAKKRGLEFNVTLEYLWELFEQQGRRCALTGTPLTFGRWSKSYETTASPDRIDSTKGYVVGNVQWVLKQINLLKQAYTDEEFVQLCCAVADHARSKANV